MAGLQPWNERLASRGHGYGASGNANMYVNNGTGSPWTYGQYRDENGRMQPYSAFVPWSFGGSMNNAMNQMAQLNMNNARTVSADRISQDNVQQAVLPSYAAANAQIESERIRSQAATDAARIAAQAQQQKTESFAKLFSALTGAVAPAFQGIAGNNPYQPQGQANPYNDHFRRLMASARGAMPGQVQQMRGPTAFNQGGYA